MLFRSLMTYIHPSAGDDLNFNFGAPSVPSLLPVLTKQKGFAALLDAQVFEVERMLVKWSNLFRTSTLVGHQNLLSMHVNAILPL